jgi:hypothetical protein
VNEHGNTLLGKRHGPGPAKLAETRYHIL